MTGVGANQAVTRTKTDQTAEGLPSQAAVDCVAVACDEIVRKLRQIIIQGSSFGGRDAGGLGGGRFKPGDGRTSTSLIFIFSLPPSRSLGDGSWNPFLLQAPKLWKFLSISGCQF